jgi:hypothetical protein
VLRKREGAWTEEREREGGREERKGTSRKGGGQLGRERKGKGGKES